MHWMFAQSLEERVALNKTTVVPGRGEGGKKKNRQIRFCVKKKGVSSKTFSNSDLCDDGRVLLLHLFLILFFIFFILFLALYIFTTWWCNCIIPRLQCVVLNSFLSTRWFLLGDVDGRLGGRETNLKKTTTKNKPPDSRRPPGPFYKSNKRPLNIQDC